ncbi:MAG: glycosyltransferase family 4 protein [Halobacteriota archaeon]|nr:glycosyltransferase family 4 protein [Halobacteriota archaeon]
MKIALLSWESLHSIRVGGISPHVTQLAEALHRHANEVHIFTRMGEGQKSCEAIDGVIYHRCPFDFNSDFISEVNNMCNSFVNNFLEVKNKDGDFDIAHGHDWLTVNALAQIKEKSDANIIFTIHSTEYGRCGNNLYEGLPRTIRDLEWYGSYIADKVITVSHHLKDEVKWLYNVPDWKMSVIYNGIDLKRFDIMVNPKEIKHRYGIPDSDHICLFTGRMTEQKGPDILIEAIPSVLKVFPDVKFVFAGNGHMTDYLKHRAWALGVSDACKFLGYIPENELNELYKTSDLVCVPSRNEPFGIVVLEAWSAGKPVVVTHNGFDYIEHGVNGLKVYDYPDSVAWGINEVLFDNSTAKNIADNGNNLVGAFSWDNIATKTLRVYTV